MKTNRIRRNQCWSLVLVSAVCLWGPLGALGQLVANPSVGDSGLSDQLGQPLGIATLDALGLVPQTQLNANHPHNVGLNVSPDDCTTIGTLWTYTADGDVRFCLEGTSTWNSTPVSVLTAGFAQLGNGVTARTASEYDEVVHWSAGDGSMTVGFTATSDPVASPSVFAFKAALRTHATDCTALTDGIASQGCWEQDSDRLFVCEPSAGGCDTAGEWKALAGAGGSSQYLQWGGVDSAANDTDYLTQEYNDAVTATATEQAAKVMVNLTGTVRNLRCRINTAPTSTHTITFTVQTLTGSITNAGADTGITCQITSTAVTCADTTNTQAVTAGDFIIVKKVDSASAAASNEVRCLAEVAP